MNDSRKRPHPGPPADDVVIARAYLNRVCEPANFAVWAFVEREGPVEAARAVRVGSAPPAIRRACAARRQSAEPERDLAAAEASGIEFVIPESHRWPHFALACLHAFAERRLTLIARGGHIGAEGGGQVTESIPPLALWVRGPADLAALGTRSAALVGSRASTPYGEHVAADLGYGLARRDVVVVSGGAYGVDAAAHRSALVAAGVTVLVSAAGLDRAYPQGNAALFESIAESGLLISESPPGAAPQRHRFLSRNRLIAAFGGATVIVEAARRSGALNTAKHCRNIGRPVLAVPGPVTSALSVGCHDLLTRLDSPASLVCSVDDVLAVVGRAGEGAADHATPDPPRDWRQAALDGLSATAGLVFDGFPSSRAVLADELGRRSGLEAREVIRVLPALRAAGLIEPADGGWRISRSAPRGGLTGGRAHSTLE